MKPHMIKTIANRLCLKNRYYHSMIEENKNISKFSFSFTEIDLMDQ